MAAWRHTIQQNVFMDSKLWSGLPEDIVDRVLASLPISSFYRLRLVCKRWNSLISSRSFLQCCSQVSGQRPWLLMLKRLDYRVCRAFDPAVTKWHALPLSFLPSSATHLVATGGGLLCFKAETGGILYVCNPLTKRWRELPAMYGKQKRGVIGMVVDRSTGSFKLIVTGNSPELYIRKTEVYDSLFNTWKVTGDLPPKIELRPEFAFSNGVLYFTTSEPFALMAYDVQQEVWSRVKVRMPSLLTCSRLVVSNGLLMLVGGVGKNGISRSVCIWKLDSKLMVWQEVARMPDNLCKKFLSMCYHNYEHISCIGHMNLICLASFGWPEAVVYEISQKSWHWLPRCPLIPCQSSCGFSWLSFDPRLDATV